MADIEFNCPRCKKTLVVDEKGAGKVIKCPECGSTIIIPRRKPAPLSVQPPAVPLHPSPQPPPPPPQPPPPPAAPQPMHVMLPPAPPSLPLFFDCPQCGSRLAFTRSSANGTAPQNVFCRICRSIIEVEEAKGCPKCGVRIPSPEARFCAACGAILPGCEAGGEAIRHEQISEAFRLKQKKLAGDRYASTGPSEPGRPREAADRAHCPHCEADLAPDAVLCVNCGRDLRTGRLLPLAGRKKPSHLYGVVRALAAFFDAVLKGVLFLLALGALFYAVSLFRDKGPAPEPADPAAAAGQSQTNAPAAEPTPGGINQPPAEATTNTVASANPVPGSAEKATPSGETPEQVALREKVSESVTAILTSWKKKDDDYTLYVTFDYSTEPMVEPGEWMVQSVKEDPKQPDVVLATVFAKCKKAGKPIRATWTFKFRKVDGAWKLASWFE